MNTLIESPEIRDVPDVGEPLHDLPPIQDGAELIAAPVNLPPDIIAGVLHLGGKMVLGGSSKSYKTWQLLDLAISVATGTAWLARFATRRGRVLYVNLELQSDFFTNRIRTICDERQVRIESGFFHVWNLRGHSTNLSTLLPRLLRGIGGTQYDLIIIDPIYKVLGNRDENKAGDISTLLNEIESMAVNTGAAVAFGAHYSKGNQSQKESIDRIGGSGVFARDPDTILNFTRHEEEECFTVEAILRNHSPLKAFVVRWEFPLMCVDLTLDPANLRKAGRKPSLTADDVLGVLTKPMADADWRELAIKNFHISRRTFERRRDELEKRGIVIFKNDLWSRK